MTAFGWTLLGLAGVIYAIIYRMIDDDNRGLREENRELRRKMEDARGRTP